MIKGLWLLFHILFLSVFNAIFFLYKGVNNPASVWISYGAIHLAYVIVWLLPYRNASMFSLYRMITAKIYFFAVLTIGIVFIVQAPENWKTAFVVQLLLFFVFAALTIFTLLGGRYAQEGRPMLDELEQQARQTDYVKMAKSKLDILMHSVIDMELRQQIREVADAISSDKIPATCNSPILIDYTSQFIAAVGSQNRESIQKAKDELLAFLRLTV